MFIITPTTNLPDFPSPSSNECATLISHVNSLIKEAQTVKSRLDECSSNPDETLSFIKSKVDEMISDASSMKNNLLSIKSEANQYQNNIML